MLSPPLSEPEGRQCPRGWGAALRGGSCAITCFCSAQDEGHQQEKQRFCPVSEKREGQAEADRHRGQAAPQPDQQPSLVRGPGGPPAHATPRAAAFLMPGLGVLVQREYIMYFFIRLYSNHETCPGDKAFLGKQS